MSEDVPSVTVDFSDQVLSSIVAALPSAPPERAALVAEILRAWAKEDLRDHLTRESRAAARQREQQVQVVMKHAKDLLRAVKALDVRGYFEIALRPQIRRDGTEILTVDVETARFRRDRAISWLNDLICSPDGPRPPPEKKVRSYLIVSDLAAIFELVTGQQPTRRINWETSKPYGPFWSFVTAVSAALPNVRSLDRAVSEVQRYQEGSPFVANLQFRHPDLWQKLRAPPD